MALADTAKLVATLELKDEFSRTARNADRTLGQLESKAGRVGRIGSEVGRGAQAAATNIAKIGVVAGGIIAASVTAGVRSLQELEDVSAQTNAVLSSTKGVAGITGDAVRDLAEKYEGLNATIDDKVIQSAENLLLTFTGIREKAFEPALQAALDMNEAMGGGEEGLQNTIIQVGKALNDPIRGATALRRVGVQLTDQQMDQIRTLVEQNDLYGAQQVILGELATEFGGSFAAAGETATGKMAKFRDAVEETQMNLATAFLPLMEKVADKASEFLADPEVQKRVAEFGEGLAEGLDQVIDFAGKLPWEAIGSAFSLAGEGAKAVLDAFTSLPDWLQTAVLTGWGLNKLTGGALGNIAGELGKMVFGGARGATPANPVFVKEVGLPGVGGKGGLPVGGAPVAGAAAGGGALAGALALGGGILLPFAMFNVLPELFKVEGAKPTGVTSTIDGTTVSLTPETTAQLTAYLPQIVSQVEQNGGRIVKEVSAAEETIDETRVAVKALQDPTKAIRDINRRSALGIEETRNEVRDLQNATQAASRAEAAAAAAARQKASEQVAAIRSTAANTATQLARVESVERATAANTLRTANKDFSPRFQNTTNVNINADFVISATSVARSLQIQQSASQTTFSGRGGDSRF